MQEKRSVQEENNVAAQQAEFHGANIDEKQKSEKKKKKKIQSR